MMPRIGVLQVAGALLAYARLAAISIGLSVPLAACGDGALRWTEDVQLPDGRVVTLTRYQEFKGPHEIGQSSTESDYWFEFVNPDTGEKVRWNGRRIQSTAALLISDKTPQLLTKTEFDGWEKSNCPNPSFLLYRYGDGGWRQVSLETIPVRKLRANMTSSPAGARVAIKENNHHLPIAITSNSMMMNRPWWISFEGLEKQTFGYQNCAHSLGLSSYFGVPLPTEKGKEDDGDGK
jgi:hypothetical protein